MAKQMTGAEMVVEALKNQGVEMVFAYPGGAVLPIYDAIFHQNKLRHILVRHEQGAGHAAEGYARSTGKVGVLLVTSGPGATNAITALTDALMDSIPLVCITGQVPTHLIGSDAFQECDTTGITRSCTKHNYLVRRVDDLPRILHEAFYIASHGRPGPVVVDIPKDVQFATGAYTFQKNVPHKTYQPQLKGDLERVRHAVEMMAAAKKPVFYTGGGVVNSGPNASMLLRELVRATGFPITSTLMGLGAYRASDKQWLGMLGMHGSFEANNAMHDCDLMICVGLSCGTITEIAWTKWVRKPRVLALRETFSAIPVEILAETDVILIERIEDLDAAVGRELELAAKGRSASKSETV